MLNPKGLRWATGFVGIWGPGEAKEEVNFAQCEEKEDGMMLWNVYNQLKKSSTRTEIAATIVAMLQPPPGKCWRRQRSNSRNRHEDYRARATEGHLRQLVLDHSGVSLRQTNCHPESSVACRV